MDDKSNLELFKDLLRGMPPKEAMNNEKAHKTGMGSHQSHKMLKDEWLTPPHITESLGEFDLDPCSPINRPWPTAKIHYTIEDDGMKLPWKGRVWCNPPYGRKTAVWLNKCAEHGDCIALIFARTETRMFFEHVWRKADSVFFIEGRLFFCHLDGTPAKANAGAPSCLVSYNKANTEAIEVSGIKGILIRLR